MFEDGVEILQILFKVRKYITRKHLSSFSVKLQKIESGKFVFPNYNIGFKVSQVFFPISSLSFFIYISLHTYIFWSILNVFHKLSIACNRCLLQYLCFENQKLSKIHFTHESFNQENCILSQQKRRLFKFVIDSCQIC